MRAPALVTTLGGGSGSTALLNADSAAARRLETVCRTTRLQAVATTLRLGQAHSAFTKDRLTTLPRSVRHVVARRIYTVRTQLLSGRECLRRDSRYGSAAHTRPPARLLPLAALRVSRVSRVASARSGAVVVYGPAPLQTVVAAQAYVTSLCENASRSRMLAPPPCWLALCGLL